MSEKEANAGLKLHISQADSKTVEYVARLRKKAEPVTEPYAKKLINELINLFETYRGLTKQLSETLLKGAEVNVIHQRVIERLEAQEYN